MTDTPPSFEELEPEIDPEIQRIKIIKNAAKDDIIRSANRYIKSRNRKELERIQWMVDTLGDAFVLVVPQKDGIPYSITFNPNEAVPGEIPTSPSGESKTS